MCKTTDHYKIQVCVEVVRPLWELFFSFFLSIAFCLIYKKKQKQIRGGVKILRVEVRKIHGLLQSRISTLHIYI